MVEKKKLTAEDNATSAIVKNKVGWKVEFLVFAPSWLVSLLS